MRRVSLAVACCLAIVTAGHLFAQDERIPHAQDKPPGPALSPEEAIAKMTVPEGFTVELVASEPDIVNPVAMTIDEKGRFWITESLEYPRRSPGPGKDRVRILEDTDADGKADKFSVFMEGLNIPSGIAVGHGGVWIANSPDILFVQDTDGDGKADMSEVVVTGFGRDDTHELPNSLTWGPDGWLYGLNGVFNPAHVVYGPKNPNFQEGQNPWDFTCAMFRIHPKTREFQVFCEGTSNPWGIAFNDEGEAFVSACVIDHLWHLTETGYYHRQGGPYPPFTWKIESIVSHKHQKAAYCGIHWYDSDAYPEQYRKKLYMGNIHGSCINSDSIERFESTYKASPGPDLLSANDAWFMPVVQKTGPDGCLYILDWYDRYHCYQDANRDPAGIDRLKGRLYRLRYKDTPRAKPEDMATLSDDDLFTELASENGYRRDIAQLLLTERLLGDGDRKTFLDNIIVSMFLPGSALRAFGTLGVLSGAGRMSDEAIIALLEGGSPTFQAWAVRIAGDENRLSETVAKSIAELRNDPSPQVRLQVAIAAAKQESIPTIPTLVAVLALAGDDPLVPRVVWQNLHPLLEKQTAEFVAEVQKLRAADSGIFPKPVIDLLPRAADRILSTSKPDTLAVAELKAGRWRGDLGISLTGKRLGVIGTGNIGCEVIRLAKAIGLDVVAWTLHPDEDKAARLGFRYVSLDDLLQSSDAVSLHTRLSDQTRGLIGARELSMMKLSAILINTSRGVVVDTAALVTALESGRLFGAGLDVYDQEPLPADHPILRCEQVVLTPHTADQTQEGLDALTQGCIDNISAWLAGTPTNVVNPDVIARR
jgi:putative membrane-bound dehydrogenase-like protein